MKIFNPVFLLISLLLYTSISGQTVHLSGSGSGYENAELKIYSQTDPVTKKLKPLLSISCDETGSFSCKIPCNKYEEIFIKTGIYALHLYVSDSSRYEILLPEYVAKEGNEELNPFFIETELIPEVFNNKDDINNLIRKFDSEYNPVFNLVAESVFRNYKKEEIRKEIIRLDKFSEVKDLPFYNNYIKCRMIMLNLIVSSSNQLKTEAEEFINASFDPGNRAFSDLAEQMYSEYFNKLSSGPLKDYFNRAIATASFSELRSVILHEGEITNKELADFVILLNLNADYYERNLPGDNVRKIISLMRSQGESVIIKSIALSMLGRINSSLPGNSPPDFSLLNNDGKRMSLIDFKGKFLLLGFVRSDSPPSIMELGIINMWYKKYAKDVQIATILTDKNFKLASGIFKNHGFNWIYLDGSKKDMLEFYYDLKMYPSFLLLDREGKIIANPSPYPSENLELTINKIILEDSTRSGSQNR
jgi:peroxiredoxin